MRIVKSVFIRDYVIHPTKLKEDVMTNVQYKLDGDKLVITVNLSERHGPSASGKTQIVATTSGNAKLEGKFAGIAFGLNVYTKSAAPAVNAVAKLAA